MKSKVKRIKNVIKEVLSDNWYVLNKVTYDYQKNDGSWQTQKREVLDRGNGAAVLLFNKKTGKVVLTKQFRMPTYLNANPSGMMIEVCAGLVEEDDPEKCILREIEEETGFRVPKVRMVLEAYMSPGIVTEIVHCFVGAYDDSMKISEGGGLASETEDIEVLEYEFEEAFGMIGNGKIRDAKTILLLQYAKMHDLVN